MQLIFYTLLSGFVNSSIIWNDLLDKGLFRLNGDGLLMNAAAEALNAMADEELSKVGKEKPQVIPPLGEEWNISLIPNKVVAPNGDYSYIINVKSKASWWCLDNNVDYNWCSVSDEEDHLLVKVEKNDFQGSHSCYATVRAENTTESYYIEPAILTIEQFSSVFDISKKELVFDQTGGSEDINVVVSEDIKYWDISNWPDDWCTITPSSVSFTVKVGETNEPREGLINLIARNQQDDLMIAHLPVKQHLGIDVTDIILSEHVKEIECGTIALIDATIIPENATDKKLIYTSTDPRVFTVSASGWVYPNKKGEATLIVSSSNGSAKDSCLIRVIQESFIKFAADEKTHTFVKRPSSWCPQVYTSSDIVDWDISSHPTWCNVTKHTQYTSFIEITPNNNLSSPRSGKVIVSGHNNEGVLLCDTLSITQLPFTAGRYEYYVQFHYDERYANYENGQLTNEIVNENLFGELQINLKRSMNCEDELSFARGWGTMMWIGGPKWTVSDTPPTVEEGSDSWAINTWTDWSITEHGESSICFGGTHLLKSIASSSGSGWSYSRVEEYEDIVNVNLLGLDEDISRYSPPFISSAFYERNIRITDTRYNETTGQTETVTIGKITYSLPSFNYEFYELSQEELRNLE